MRRVLPPLFLFLITIAAYLPAVRHGGFVWDDTLNVSSDPLLRDRAGLRDIWTKIGPAQGGTFQYYPFTYTSFWLEYRLWGLNPAGYHLTNVILHALNAVLVWIILLRLRVPGALAAAAIFALHPVNAESAAWISERKNVLSAAFFFLSLLSFIRFLGLEDQEAQKDNARKVILYCAGLLFFTCALLSKTAVAILPPVILLLTWWRRGSLTRRDVLLMIPLFIPALLAGAGTSYLEQYSVGAAAHDPGLSFPRHILLAGKLFWFYAGKILWPHPLAFIYPRWDIAGASWLHYLFPLAAAGLCAWLWLAREKIGRAPLTAVLYFSGTLFPVMGFFNFYFMRYSYAADHFLYLPGIGLIALFSAAAASLKSRIPAGLPEKASQLVLPGILAILGILTWRQSAIYSSEDRVWEETLRRNSDAWLAHNNLGSSLYAQGKYEDALTHYQEMLRLQPALPEASYNMGLALEALGRDPEAAGYYSRALRVKPDFKEAAGHLAATLAAIGGPRTESLYRKALSIEPDSPELLNDLGLALASQGKKKEAVEQYRKALRVRYAYPEALNNLGLALSGLGSTIEAIAAYRDALRIKPDFPQAHNNLGLLLVANREMDEALAHYREAVRLLPDYAQAHNNLGVALCMTGKIEEALGHYKQASRLRPGDLEIRNNVALALSVLGRRLEAAEEYRKILRAKPDFKVIYPDSLSRHSK